MKNNHLSVLLVTILVLIALAAGCAAPAPAPTPTPAPAPSATPAPAPSVTPAPAPAAPAPATAPKKTYVIKVAHSMTTTNIRHVSLLKFAELADKYTSGQVKVEIFPAGQLYGDADTLKAVIIGAIQMSWQPTGQLAPINTSIPLLNCPGIYGSVDEIYNMQQSPQIKELGKGLYQNGVYYLGEVNLGIFRMFVNSKRPGPMPSDWVGLKIRTSPSLIDFKMAQAIGSNAVIMEFSEVPTALAQNTIDGLFTSLATGSAQKLYELAKYATAGPHFGPSPGEVLINRQFWDSLPADLKDIIANKVFPETLLDNQKLMTQFEKDAANAWSAGGQLITIDTPEQNAAWLKALQPARDFVAKDAPPDALPLVEAGKKYTAWRK